MRKNCQYFPQKLFKKTPSFLDDPEEPHKLRQLDVQYFNLSAHFTRSLICHQSCGVINVTFCFFVVWMQLRKRASVSLSSDARYIHQRMCNTIHHPWNRLLGWVVFETLSWFPDVPATSTTFLGKVFIFLEILIDDPVDFSVLLTVMY